MMEEKNTVKVLYILSLPSSILVKIVKEVNEISKYFKENSSTTAKKSYAQILANLYNSSNIVRKTLRIKEAFPKLQNKKIKLVQKIISGQEKPKLKLNITTKGLLWKQVIVPMSNNSVTSFIKDSSTHIININRILKNIKSNTMADFIHVKNKSIVITTNNIASPSDLQAIEQYVKSIVCVKSEHVQSPRLPQFKLYLKIIGVPYLSKNSNTCITSNDIKRILKNNHIFIDIILASKPRIIKVSPKLDISIIWIHIWDVQSRTKTKSLINRWFNIESFIATVHEANVSPGILQCKNCWK